MTVSLKPEESATKRLLAVTHGADDAEEDEAGKVSLDSSDLELTVDKTPQTVGVRFRAVPIPPGVRVKRAYLQFEVDETSSEATELVLAGQAADDAAAFSTTAKDVSSRRARREPSRGNRSPGPKRGTPERSSSPRIWPPCCRKSPRGPAGRREAPWPS